MQAQDETFASTPQGPKHWVNQEHLGALMALPRLSWDTHLPMGTGASCSSNWLSSEGALHFVIPFLQPGIHLLPSAGLLWTLALVHVSVCVEVLMDAGPSPAGLSPVGEDHPWLPAGPAAPQQ